MFIDANIFIYAATGSDSRSVKCRLFFDRVEKGEQNAITSSLVLDEVLHVLQQKINDRKKSSDMVLRMASIPHLKVCDVGKSQFEKAILFFREGLDIRDALHAAVMKSEGATAILSYDSDFDRLSWLKRNEP